MGIFSGGSGGGGPAAGTYLAVADPDSVTLDTTTYANTIRGGGHKYSTLVFPRDTGALAFAIAGDAFPRFLIGTDLNDAGLAFGDGTSDPYGGDAYIYLTGGGVLGLSNAPPLYSVLATDTSASGHKITSLTDPASAQDAATKAYVDAQRFATITRESFAGANVSIANHASGNMTWDSPTGTALLDLTDPAVPLFVTSGVYAVTVQVKPTAMTVAGGFSVQLQLGGVTLLATSPPSSTEIALPNVVTTFTRYSTTGQALLVTVVNFDGAATRNFVMDASVQRIS